MDFEDESSSMFVAPQSPLSFPVLPPRNRDHKQPPPNHLVPERPINAAPRFNFFEDALGKNLGRLDVDNMSSERQAFVLYPSIPTRLGSYPEPKDLRYGIFQSSLYVDKFSEDGNGSVTFTLPFDEPLSWANADANAGILVVAGTETMGDTSAGLGEHQSTPSRTAWTLLSSGDTDGHPAKNVCAMTVPTGSEPRFLSKTELDRKNYHKVNDLEPGTIVIFTDSLQGVTNDLRPFVGIGAINPRFPKSITPIMTWIARPNRRYEIKPDMGTWQLASAKPQGPGTIIDPKLYPNSAAVTFGAPPSQPASISLGMDNVFA